MKFVHFFVIMLTTLSHYLEGDIVVSLSKSKVFALLSGVVVFSIFFFLVILVICCLLSVHYESPAFVSALASYRTDFRPTM